MGKQIRLTTYGRKPRTALAALKQARQFLVDEGKDHWCKGTEFTGKRKNTVAPVTDPDNPLCGNWGVCAIGAVELVAGDLFVDDEGYVSRSYTVPVVADAIDLLNDATKASGKGHWVYEFNDKRTTKRADVIRLFDKAIEMAERKVKARA